MAESEWWAQMAKKYGSEEAVRQEMTRRAINSRKNYSGTGGFHALKNTDPDKLKEISKLGGKTGGRGRAKTKD